jgi:hypothetical protein
MFGELAEAVGFRRAETLPQDAPDSLSLELWRSDFAIIALVRVSKQDSESLDEAFTLANGWLSPVLEAEEKQGRLIDGYLLLALPSELDEGLRKRVREIERDTSVCRKHVLWPESDQSWSVSLNAVTTLGLPASGPLSNTLIEPPLPTVATRALKARDAGSSFYDVATMIENMPEEDEEYAG